MVTLPSGTTVEVDVRFWQGNQAIRSIVGAAGGLVPDAETAWLEAVTAEGWNALFPNDGTTSNHPSTHGIAASYGQVFKLISRSLRASRLATTPAAPAAAPTNVSDRVTKVKTANQVVNNTNTSNSDAELRITHGNIEEYEIEYVLFDKSTAKLKVWWTVPNGTLGGHSATGPAYAATACPSLWSSTRPATSRQAPVATP